MQTIFVTDTNEKAIPIQLIEQQTFSSWLAEQNSHTKNWLTTKKYQAEPGNVSLIPDSEGHLSQVICCITSLNHFWDVGHLSIILPENKYVFVTDPAAYTYFAIAWGLGAYQFKKYKSPKTIPSKLILPSSADIELINNTVDSIYLVRDLINTPTEDMGPSELAEAIISLGKEFKALSKQVIGEELLKQNYGCIHMVGRASDDAPRLIDLRWGDEKHPKITLVGKGVCFDSGGLDIKPSSNMLLMKKDMGGAAHVLGLARMIMQAKLPIRLRVLIPAVENVISGNAYRPGDVIKSKAGLTIEIGNTDAEGRLVLADALAEAISEQPDLLIDIATLTGAARVALGTDLPALFSNNDQVSNDLIKISEEIKDPIWRLPLFAGYRESLNSSIADINNNSCDGYGGAITAALFLKEFVPDAIPWVHFDLMAWNLKGRPGRPQGGEAMAIRGLFAYLRKKYAS